ncbi:hypothetical protein [Christensenella timonensis]|uniref:hypothetical protein n=1 Tax=Christensenella timonensis TaxID=1816678 RepID=UPI000835D26A|nr:hypothetical protein [Christensenella timonensis]
MKRVLTVVLVTLLAVVMVSCAQQEVKPSEMPAPSEPPELSESATPQPAATAEESVQPSQSAQPEETAGMANPWKTVADAAEAEKLTGLTMSALPEGAADVTYSVMESDKTAQAVFTWNGDTYTFRMTPGTPETDLSGMFVDFANTEDLTWKDYPFTVSYNEGAEGKAAWHDELTDVTYSVTMSQGATRDKLAEVSKVLIPAG